METDCLGDCSHEGQIHSSDSSSVFAQHLQGRKSRIKFCLVISNNSTRPKSKALVSKLVNAVDRLPAVEVYVLLARDTFR